MSTFFRIEMLPAQHGDALWIEYGDAERTNRVLIDGGTVQTYPYLIERLQRTPGDERYFELIALTHVDADHIEGLLRLFADKPLAFSVGRVLFNGWQQMHGMDGLLGPTQGEFLSALLADRAKRAWKPDAPAVVVTADGSLPVIELPGGMRLTVLSPTPDKLQAMAKEWKKSVREAGFKPGDLEAAWDLLAQRKRFLPKQGLLGGPLSVDRLVKETFRPDQARANGSSIAFLAEFGGKSALLLADAHPEVVRSSLERLCRERNVERIAVDAVKLAHHGSRNNTNPALLARISSLRYLVSTSGAQFGHPDRACIARVISYGKPRELIFNYRSEFTRPWLSGAAQRKYGYTARVRSNKELSIVTDL
jgi:beta-lactamase superfamily II metal-dependent hydrolase